MTFKDVMKDKKSLLLNVQIHGIQDLHDSICTPYWLYWTFIFYNVSSLSFSQCFYKDLNSVFWFCKIKKPPVLWEMTKMYFCTGLIEAVWLHSEARENTLQFLLHADIILEYGEMMH